MDAYPEQSYRGNVSKIVPTADRAKATVLVKIKFKSYDSRVLPEMGAKITFLAKDSGDDAAAQPLLTVPSAAVAARNGRPVVYKVKGDQAVEVPVAVGQRIGAFVEIKNGVKEGDKVVGRVDEKLHAGAKVALKNP